jgi:HSP20 family molecular chaperone IbpA
MKVEVKMSSNYNDDLPDPIKRAIEDILSNLESMSMDELLAFVKELFGQEFVNQLETIFKRGGSFTMSLDDRSLARVGELIDAFMYEDVISDFDTLQEEVEPYYEISDIHDGMGEIIIELPGISSIDQIEWYELDNEIFLYTIDALDYYRLVIPLPEYFHVLENYAAFRNGLLIIPYIIR